MTTPIHLYNSLTRRKEPLTPLDLANVRMYVCGPTVYARPHIGNARSVVVYDVLFRLLRHVYGEAHVTYARNITDVDDKINAAAIERGISIQQLTQEVTAQFHEDMGALNCLRPTIEPTATGHMTQIIAMIERLIANGHAYAAQGHVLFDIASAVARSEEKEALTGRQREPSASGASLIVEASRPEQEQTKYYYGHLSRRSMDEMVAGARVEVAPYKKNPGDFVLWKPASEKDDASSKFDSPWGVGRPGWHIECSAMSTTHLGETFDLHGGGADLMFPHHENECAQSRCANPQSEFAKMWVHNGFLTVNGEKMSKSLGNFITVKDLLDQGVHGEVIRFALMSTHYRKPLDWTPKLVEDAKKQLDSLYRKMGEASTGEATVDSLLDDLNVPDYLAKLHTLSGDALRKAGEVLGLLQLDAEAWFKGESTEGDEAIVVQINARLEARKSKNWAESDRIRDELKAQGIILEDRPDGTTDWRRA
jgi:cysteinyl-tRNA synthetase